MRIAVAFGLACLTSTGAAAAQVQTYYPYCAYGGKTSEGVSCDYATLAQCQAFTAGGGGSCVANPRSAPTSSPRSGRPAPKQR